MKANKNQPSKNAKQLTPKTAAALAAAAVASGTAGKLMTLSAVKTAMVGFIIHPL